MNCICCDKLIEDEEHSQQCCFHPGTYSLVFSTGADAGRYDSNMAYRDVYFWSCCGKREPSRFDSVNPTNELPPLRSPGCCTIPKHHYQAKILIATTTALYSFASAAVPAVKTAGFISTIIQIEEFSVSHALSCDAIVFLLTEDSHTFAMDLTEEIRNALPNLPIVIFSEPDRVDGWKLQAETLINISEQRLVSALKGAIRNQYIPNGNWRPQTFLSYTRKDAVLVEKYIEEFSRMERACWVDTNILVTGVAWSSEILKGIEASDFFVLIISPNTPDRTYCWLELETARKANKTIFVISYDDSLSKLFQIKEIRDFHWHKQLLKPRFVQPILARVNDQNSPSFVLFEPIPTNLKYSDELSQAYSIKRCIQDWPTCFEL